MCFSFWFSCFSVEGIYVVFLNIPRTIPPLESIQKKNYGTMEEATMCDTASITTLITTDVSMDPQTVSIL